ncbi:hypothetical protein [Mucisphaera calidilacus]|uniref:hypothetical protein n=1 Tax=Mucisphaera calidilacus TaxID=2527982 RepID=UPI0011AB1943|nr:hypothetical protein [Mucisphaera calidilacus]
MAEGHGRERWAHTSVLCCLIANTHRDPRKGRPYRPSDFDPYQQQQAPRSSGPDRQGLAMLRQVLESTSERS